MRLKVCEHRVSVLIVTLCLNLFLNERSCDAIRLNANGGYDIVIGIENVVEPAGNVYYFLDQIRVGIDSFSNELWKATNKRFFINSVGVLVPSNWWSVHDSETATWQHLKNSEIRITEDVPSPNVVNPNPCGSSGLYLELPHTFFQTPDEGNVQYGEIGKALVNLWARYRFGVWEEHGIPGDIKYPYFHVHPSFDPKWEATGCSNEELTGSFRTIDNEEAERCDPYQSTMPGHDCRYFPDSDNTANSSLLSYHYWQDSVVEFCDSKTHNYAAPNRHNLFCSHRSVWDVIRESEDYTSTKTCEDTVRRPEFKVLKESFSPEFYVLIDTGRTVTPEKVLQEIMGAMGKFVVTPSLERINIAVGTYPHANQGKNHYYVKEEIGWSPISAVPYELQRVFEKSANPDGPVIRDFGLAIKEIAEKIKERDHEAGVVILVIKRGAGPNTFDKLTYEQEVIASIQEDNRINVFAIETQQGTDLPYTNLKSLTAETSGLHHLVNDTQNTARKMQWLLDEIQIILEQSSIMNSKATWVTQKQFTKPNEIITIPIFDDATLVKIHLITTAQFPGSKIIIKPAYGEYDLIIGSDKGEWDENSDLSRRAVHTYNIINPRQGSEWELSYTCDSGAPSESDCNFFLIVTAETDRPLPRNSIQFSSKSISIDVSTSAQNNYVDMSQQGTKIVPFAIFAKIEMEQKRVLRLENVNALVRLSGSSDASVEGDWLIPLKDDGSGLPDVSDHDGIYSGVFTPLEDGLYQISVTAIGVSEVTVSRFQDATLVHHAGALMPKNQISFGCQNSSKPRCISAVPRGSFSRSTDMSSTVAVENAETFKPGKPMKILDFTVTTLPDFNVEFQFTSPKLLGLDESPDEFRIYMAPHVDNFLGSTELTKLLVQERGHASGTKVTIPYNAGSAAIPYYAVEAMYKGQKGGPSNVVGVATSSTGPILPTPKPTTTTIVPPEETSTTEFPWPTETTTLTFPSTTDEEEMSDEPDLTTTSEFSTSSTSSTTTEPPSTTDDWSITSSTTTESSASSTSTTESPSSTSTTTDSSSSSSDITDIGSSSTSTTTEVPSSSTTEEPEVTDIEFSSTSPSSSTSTTTEAPEVSSTSTPIPSSSSSTTTEDPEITEIISSTIPPSSTSSPTTTPEPEITSTTTESISTSTSTQEPTTTIPSSSSTTDSSSDLTDLTSSSSTTTSTTEIPIITEEDEISTTTSIPTTSPPIPSSSSTSTTAPTDETTTPTSLPTETSTPSTSSSSTTEPPVITSTGATSEDSSSSTTISTTAQPPTTSRPSSSSLSTSTTDGDDSDEDDGSTPTSSSFKLLSTKEVLILITCSSLLFQRILM